MKLKLSVMILGAVTFVAMLFAQASNPVSLGIVTQTDKTGSPVKLSTNLSADADARFNAIEVEGIKTRSKTLNVGVVFIGTFTMNVSTGVGVIKSLTPGEQWSFGDAKNGNVFDASKLYLQTLNNNDGVQVRGIKR